MRAVTLSVPSIVWVEEVGLGPIVGWLPFTGVGGCNSWGNMSGKGSIVCGGVV